MIPVTEGLLTECLLYNCLFKINIHLPSPAITSLLVNGLILFESCELHVVKVLINWFHRKSEDGDYFPTLKVLLRKSDFKGNYYTHIKHFSLHVIHSELLRMSINGTDSGN